jgi:hypothetical protein
MAFLAKYTPKKCLDADQSLRALSLQLQADIIDPANEGSEPGQDQRVRNDIFAIDIELSAEEANKDDDGQG